jgi:hypothetical protein
MHIYANPSHVPVVLIEQHVMIVPQHGCYKHLLANAQGSNNITVPPNLQEDSVAGNPSGGKNSGHVLRAVIFVHGFQVSFVWTGALIWIFFMGIDLDLLVNV